MIIRPSLISSCFTRDAVGPRFPAAEKIVEFFSGVNDDTTNKTPLDVYAFMESDAHDWAGWLDTREDPLRDEKGDPFPDTNSLSAVDFLAALSPEQIRRIAGQMMNGAGLYDIQVVALASFIPEIARNERTRANERAIAAISSLIQLACHLTDGDGPPPVVEVVAGSKREDITVHNKDISVELIDDLEGQQRVLATLNKALIRASSPLKQQRMSVLDARIAIELEPGPLFLLRDLQTLRQFAEGIRQSNSLVRDCVGLNLDIAHWRLAGIPPEVIDLRAHEVFCEAIAERIFHSHIAGHHQHGHFGDAPLLDMNSRSEYLPWLKNLAMLSGGDGRTPIVRDGFTGHVAVEFEAAKCDDYVIRSIQELASLLR